MVPARFIAPAFVCVSTMRAVLGLSKSTAYRLAPRLGAVRIGGSLRVPIETLRVQFGDAVAAACRSAAR